MLLFLGMKASPKKLLPLIVFAIAVTSLFSVQPAQAYTVTLQQMGANVVATGNGAINLTGLTFESHGGAAAAVYASQGIIQTGPSAAVDFYLGFTGPTRFGSGGVFSANSSIGDLVGNSAFGLAVPMGYVSNTNLTSSATWDTATFASLGVRQGTYVWSWGTGLPNQNFTLIIGSGVSGVPDAGSTVSLLGCALLGLAALRRKLGW